MSFVITCGSVAVTLPKYPHYINPVAPAAVTSKYHREGGASTIVSRFKTEGKLNIECDLYSAGMSNATLMGSYISPLTGFIGKNVTLTVPDSQFGGTWLLTGFSYPRVSEGAFIRYKAALTFEQATSHVVLIT